MNKITLGLTTAGMALALSACGSTSNSASGEASGETPKVLIVAIDMSASTMGLDDQAQKRIGSDLRRKIEGLPLGSNVVIFTVGDDRESVVSQEFGVTRYATEESDTPEALAVKIPDMVVSYLQEAHAKGKYQGQSALTGAVWDANKYCNDATCDFIFFTDGMQNTASGVKYPDDFEKPLVPLEGMRLANMDVTLKGVGAGSDPNEAMSDIRIKVEAQWRKFLSDAGAKSITISRL